MDLASLNHTTGYTRVLIDLRTQMLELQRQLGTGQASETYGGLGPDRFTALSVNDRTSEIRAYQATISLTSIRLGVADQALDRLSQIAIEVKGEAFSSEFQPEGNGKTIEQNSTVLRLDEAVAMLNSRADGRYLFGGTELDAPPVASSSEILNGDAARAGLVQMMNERKAADLGTGDMGRLTTVPGGATLTIREDGNHPFGFKITSISSDAAGATVVGPSGSPPEATFNLGAVQPVEGDKFRVALALPDGSQTDIELTAVTGTPGVGEFQIGATIAGTVANMDATFRTEVQRAANADLEAASSIAASRAFFDGTPSAPPMRVDGPPFETATGLVAGTADNTVIWYRGSTSAGNPRLMAEAAVDDGLKVGYGLEANEEAFRWMMQHVAVFAADTFSETDPNDRRRYDALKQRLGVALDYPAGTQTVNQVRVEVGIGRAVMDRANERHKDSLAVLENLRSDIQGVDNNEVAAELLTIQTRLEASYQVTSIVSRMTLSNYLR